MALAGDHVRVLVSGYELTADHNRIQIDDAYNMLPVVAFGDAAKKFIPGQRQLRMMHTGFMDAAAARSHPVLKGIDVNGAVSVFVGQNTAPVVGDPVYTLLTQQNRYRTNPQINQVIPFNADFANRGDNGGWGKALAITASFTSTANGTGLDNGAATSSGGAAFLHLLTAAATDRYSMVIEGSTTGAFSGEETTLETFDLDASVIGSERISIAGSIPRYTRWKATRTTGSAGDTVQIAVTLMRL
jgi:hypothetical protein